MPRTASSPSASAGPVALYHRVYTILREQLREGRYPPDVALPGEMEFAGRFGVSRVTMRRALDELKREGLIERTRGRGSFARLAPQAAPVRGSLSGLLENIVAMGLKTSVRIIALDTIEAPADVAEALRLPAGAMVQKAIRVRSLSGAPLAVMTTFVPESVASFTRRELTDAPMLKLLEATGVRVSHADQTISAKLADTFTAPLLEVTYGAALLAVNRLVFDQNERPVQLLRGLYRPDRYEYQMTLARAGDAARVWVSRDDAVTKKATAQTVARPAVRLKRAA
jgi:GntR family transcriptional regulator